jgi:hypothetical protein
MPGPNLRAVGKIRVPGGRWQEAGPGPIKVAQLLDPICDLPAIVHPPEPTHELPGNTYITISGCYLKMII